MTTPPLVHPPPDDVWSWRLPRAGWAYVAVVTVLAAVSFFSEALPAYVVLLVITLPVGVAAQLGTVMLGFGLGALLPEDSGWSYVPFGVVFAAVWVLCGWANAKLAQVTWRTARAGWLRWRARAPQR